MLQRPAAVTQTLPLSLPRYVLEAQEHVRSVCERASGEEASLVPPRARPSVWEVSLQSL